MCLGAVGGADVVWMSGRLTSESLLLSMDVAAPRVGGGRSNIATAEPPRREFAEEARGIQPGKGWQGSLGGCAHIAPFFGRRPGRTRWGESGV
jgi:hypothetical protein